MNQRTFAKLVKRDQSDVASGEISDQLIPNHRINRSVGGTDAPSNLVLMGSIRNGELESNATVRAEALKYGWKLESWQNPLEEPFYHRGLHQWVLADDEWNLTQVPIPARMFRK